MIRRWMILLSTILWGFGVYFTTYRVIAQVDESVIDEIQDEMPPTASNKGVDLQIPSPPKPIATQPSPQALLEEMGRIEKQIDELEMKRLEKETQLYSSTKDLEHSQTTIDQRSEIDKFGHNVLSGNLEQTSQTLESLGRQLIHARNARQQAYLDQRYLLPLVAKSAVRKDTSIQSLLAMSLLYEHPHDQVNIVSQQIFRIETEQANLMKRASSITELTSAHDAASERALNALKERHAQLVLQVKEIQKNLDTQNETLQDVSSQRQRIQDLIKDIAINQADNNLQTYGDIKQSSENGEISGMPSILSDDSSNSSFLTKDSSMWRYYFWKAALCTVHALATGTVRYSGPFGAYRHLMIIDHGGGWCTLYGNMTRAYLDEDSIVGPGEPLGIYQLKEGSAGASMAPLWFEVRQGVNLVEPTQWPSLPLDWERRLLSFQSR